MLLNINKKQGKEIERRKREILFVYFLIKEGLCLSLKMKYLLLLESR